MRLEPRTVEMLHGHIFCGIGGGAKGMNRGRAVVGNVSAKFRCVGGIDVDAAAIRDFERLVGVKGTVLDLFSREQYIAFHGKEPPAGWRQSTPADIRLAWGGERPHIGFGSAPCKGFSGLLSESKSKSAKYDALNQLALRGLWLALEAFKDDPLDFWLWENVPRIATRGRAVLDQMIALLDRYGYAVAETTHDCGELGGLAQSRKRFLLVARHREKVPPFLYEPVKRRVRGVGEVIGRLPVPGAEAVLPMHRLPMLQWQTWVRLAFVEAGSDWRSLNRLRVENGVLRDFALMPAATWNNGALGVRRWDDPTGTVTSRGTPTCGAFSVADPRIDGHERSVQMGVGYWKQPAAVIKGDVSVGTGRYAIADPRYGEGGLGDHAGKMRVEGWDEPAHTVTGSDRVGSGAMSIADPRHPSSTFRIVRISHGDLEANSGVGIALRSEQPRKGSEPRSDGCLQGRHARYEGSRADTEQESTVSERWAVGLRDGEEPEVLNPSLSASGLRGATTPEHRGPAPQREEAGQQVVESELVNAAGQHLGQGGPRDVDARREALSDAADGCGHPDNSIVPGVIEGDRRSFRTSGELGPQHSTRPELEACEVVLPIADPRTGYAASAHRNKFAVQPWDGPAGTVTGAPHVTGGAQSVADPRVEHLRNGGLGVKDWEDPAGVVAGDSLPTNGAFSVADPRPPEGERAGKGKYKVTGFEDSAGCVIAASTTGNSAFAVADPRPVALRDGKDDYKTTGEYGVVPWKDASGSVVSHGQHDNGRWSVADPREPLVSPAQLPLPAATDRLVAVIQALDGTYHRPFTTLELAAIQSLVDVDEILELEGKSDSAWRERIGNAVPPDAAEAIAGVMGTTLLLAWAGETFVLSATPVWVQPVAIALAVHQPFSEAEWNR